MPGALSAASTDQKQAVVSMGRWHVLEDLVGMVSLGCLKCVCVV